ncbi:universal stress protein [Natronococcus occultus]|uniref:Universal stress protein UspA-like protein n=1 Tax=Natronococcus occultus SP4 TaxID=694430 RepID=L0JTY6_9EURY|nr:universal stress protein [Natronococcus occultus]AGB36216.1 universal stress protein UspA-like protein [Natronococcus occultus SP4]
MTSTVLVPIDDSERSSDALEHALETHPDATITAIHVVDPRKFYTGTGIEGSITADYERIREGYEQQAQALLEDAREAATEHGVEIETEYVTGAVARSIVDYTADHDVDQIVMGSHGRSGASRILLGSVAEAVARRSPVPVTIVR